MRPIKVISSFITIFVSIAIMPAQAAMGCQQ